MRLQSKLKMNYYPKVKMLRDRKANMWLRNAKGDLPLHEAASSGRRELVLWLLDQRPKHVNTTSNDGRTILHIAASNDYADMCKVHISFYNYLNFEAHGNCVCVCVWSKKSKQFQPLDTHAVDFHTNSFPIETILFFFLLITWYIKYKV